MKKLIATRNHKIRRGRNADVDAVVKENRDAEYNADGVIDSFVQDVVFPQHIQIPVMPA